MFPYADDTRSYSVPVWTFILIGLNVLFFFLSYSSGEGHYVRTIFAYGTIPARFADVGDITFSDDVLPLLADAEIDQGAWPSPIATLFTAMFLHGGIMHLIGNMWFMWLFADNVEDRFGKLIFPIFYILCGVLAGLMHIVTNAGSTVPAIGASGAIAGVMGAYIYLFPRGRIATLFTYGYYWRTVQVPAFLYLLIWLGLQFMGGLAGMGASNVAFWAHIGGFLAGLALAFILKKLNLVQTYPGDRGYTGPTSGNYPPQPPRQVSTQPARKKRYVWRE